MSDSAQQEGGRAPIGLLPLLRALGDLKRSRCAGREGSIATRLFAAAWSHLSAGAASAEAMLIVVREALIATRLGDLDAACMQFVGIPASEAQRIRLQAAADACTGLDPGLSDRVLNAPSLPIAACPPPGFVARLAAQPRAGAVAPGRGRLVLEPPENHAEHCAIAAIAGVLLAPSWHADPETVFVAGLAHHLHNALLPDVGYAGELLLGRWLEPAMERATAAALSELPSALRDRVSAARAILPGAATAEGRAFHAADTLDRVLQLEHHLRAAGTTMAFALREMQLVHPGPVKPFQDAVLERMGLAG
jgi:hypothetical protein